MAIAIHDGESGKGKRGNFNGNVVVVSAGNFSAVITGRTQVGVIPVVGVARKTWVVVVPRRARIAGTLVNLDALEVRLNRIGPTNGLVAGRSRARYGKREVLVVVLRVLQDAHTDLFEVGLARRTSRIFAGSGEDGEKNRRENRYNGDDDEQFDRSERGFPRIDVGWGELRVVMLFLVR